MKAVAAFARKNVAQGLAVCNVCTYAVEISWTWHLWFSVVMTDGPMHFIFIVAELLVVLS